MRCPVTACGSVLLVEARHVGLAERGALHERLCPSAPSVCPLDRPFPNQPQARRNALSASNDRFPSARTGTTDPELTAAQRANPTQDLGRCKSLSWRYPIAEEFPPMTACTKDPGWTHRQGLRSRRLQAVPGTGHRNLERWHEHGLIRNLPESAPVHPLAFDSGAIDLERERCRAGPRAVIVLSRMADRRGPREASRMNSSSSMPDP